MMSSRMVFQRHLSNLKVVYVYKVSIALQFSFHWHNGFVILKIYQKEIDSLQFRYLFSFTESFCDDKRQFTINKHPYEPCSLVVYCLNTGPLVYEIECEPGQCYDANSTKCVEDSVVRSGIAPSTETVRAPSVGQKKNHWYFQS